jgi:hypothetical protein
MCNDTGRFRFKDRLSDSSSEEETALQEALKAKLAQLDPKLFSSDPSVNECLRQPRSDSTYDDDEAKGPPSLDEVILELRSCQCVCRREQGELEHLRNAFLQKRIRTSATVVEPRLCQQLKEGVKRELIDPLVRGNQEFDYHPGSGKQVIDLVHPSLYCYVDGVSARRAIDSDSNGKKATLATLQWLPTDIQVTKEVQGDAPIIHCEPLSYINNLPRRTPASAGHQPQPQNDAPLEKTVMNIFGRMVPMFEQVLEAVKDRRLETKMATVRHQLYLKRKAVNFRPMTEEENAAEDAEMAAALSAGAPWLPLTDRKLQVIVKIGSTQLTPDSPSFAGGTWHLEGTPAEQIVATGIYYYDFENITESELQFRTVIDQEEVWMLLPQDGFDFLEIHTGLKILPECDDRKVPTYVDLGAVVAEEGKALAFPNCFLHRVAPFELKDKSKPGHRSILVFFLVNPETEILSTSDVLPQNPLHAEAEGGSPMSLEEAKEYRRLLMFQRKYYVAGQKEFFARSFSLCEH